MQSDSKLSNLENSIGRTRTMQKSNLMQPFKNELKTKRFYPKQHYWSILSDNINCCCNYRSSHMSAQKSLQMSIKQVFNLTTIQPRGEEEPRRVSAEA